MTSGMYNNFKNSLFKRVFDLHNDVIKIALIGNGYTFSPTHIYWAEVSSYEISNGDGYTTGGKTISNSVVLTDFKTSEDVIWSNSTIIAYGAVIYDDTVENKPLIAWIDFGIPQSSSEGDFRITWFEENNTIISLN